MKNFKNREEFIKSINEAVEMTEDQLESQRKANWKIVADFTPEGETQPLLRKGDKVYFDEPGQRLVVVDGGNQGMIVDLSHSQLEEIATKLWDSGSFSKEAFPVYNVQVVDGESGDADKLGEYISDFHEIDFDATSPEENYIQFSKEWVEKQGINPKKFRAIVEEEAKRLGMNVHVSVKRLFDDGTGNLQEV
jgi:hypothetical protein